MNSAPKTYYFDKLRTGLLGLMLAAATLCQAEELGRLFFTPEQRARIDFRQQDNSPDPAHSITVNGIVQQHGGARTIWINGIPQAAGKSNERTPESVPIAVPGQSHPVQIKVGQKILIAPSASAPASAAQHPPTVRQ